MAPPRSTPRVANSKGLSPVGCVRLRGSRAGCLLHTGCAGGVFVLWYAACLDLSTVHKHTHAVCCTLYHAAPHLTPHCTSSDDGLE